MTDLLHFDRKKWTKINVHFLKVIWRIISFFFEKMRLERNALKPKKIIFTLLQPFEKYSF